MTWIQTVSGRRYTYGQSNACYIGDIAHSISRICRFNGHSAIYYSVADHSCNVCDYVIRMTDDPEIHLLALLHDAHEAYVCDVPRPMKELIPDYRSLEDQAKADVARSFGLRFTNHPHVSRADENLLFAEAHVVGNTVLDNWAQNNPVDQKFVTISDDWSHAKSRFLQYCKRMGVT